MVSVLAVPSSAYAAVSFASIYVALKRVGRLIHTTE